MNKDVYIVAGGTSLKNFDFSKLKDKNVIAINKSILDVPWATHFITMDYTFIDQIHQKTDNRLNKEQFQNLPCIKYFVVAKDNNYIKFIDNHYVDIRSHYIYNLDIFNHIIISHKAFGIGWNNYEFVHGCNSGYCGFQLAIILKYKNIHLLGVDLYTENTTHYHSGYKLNQQEFDTRLNFYYKYWLFGIHNLKLKLPNVTIYSYSNHSKLNKLIKYKPLEDIK